MIEYVRFAQSVTVTARVPLRSIAGMLTYCLFIAFAETASPISPLTQLAPLTRVAVWPLADESPALDPEPSSKVQ